MAVPAMWDDVFRFANAVRTTHGDFYSAIKRLYGYFATPLEFKARDNEVAKVSERDVSYWQDMFSDIGYLEHVVLMGANVAFNGFDVITVQKKSHRMLYCEACESWRRMVELASHPSSKFTYRPENFKRRSARRGLLYQSAVQEPEKTPADAPPRLGPAE